MLLEKNKEKCCGCGACQEVCVHKAIKLEMDQEGFFYPSIASEQCNSCGSCTQVCPMLEFDRKVSKNNTPEVYGGWHLNRTIRLKSSSGGAFTALAEEVLKQGGAVVGAAFDPQLKLKHQIIWDDEKLELLRGSKYLQSSMDGILTNIKKILNAGTLLLFCGTPCQVAALKTFLLGQEYSNLITLDLVCHGVPSPLVFEKYTKELEHKEGRQIVGFQFRDKSLGWKKYIHRVIFKNSESTSVFDQNPFMKGFLQNLYLRPSCHNCPFNRIPRVGDISLGDYWGVHKYFPELDDDQGTSLLLVNSKKGNNLIEATSYSLHLIRTNLKSAIAENPCIVQSVGRHTKRQQFFNELNGKSFEKLIMKYCPPPSKTKKIMKMIYSMRNFFHKHIKPKKLLIL